jgi:hypothetical protein
MLCGDAFVPIVAPCDKNDDSICVINRAWRRAAANRRDVEIIVGEGNGSISSEICRL